MLKQIQSKLKNLLSLGRITGNSIKASGGAVDTNFQVATLEGEVIPDVPYYQQFGFLSAPNNKVRVVVLSKNGNKNDPVIIADDANSSLPREIKLQEGQVMIWNSDGNYMLFDAESEITIMSGKVTIKGGDLEVAEGTVKDQNTTTPSMQNIRDAYNSHTHPSGAGSPPTPLM